MCFHCHDTCLYFRDTCVESMCVYIPAGLRGLWVDLLADWLAGLGWLTGWAGWLADLAWLAGWAGGWAAQG